jgi:FPC/CPF motif-containing protein YcgG
MEIQQLQQELARTKAELEAWRQEAEHLRAAANTISRRPHSLIPCAQSVLDLACHGQAFNGSQPLQVTLEDLISVSEANGLATVLCRYSELEDEQSLGDLVRSLVASGTLVADPALPAPLGPGNHNKVRASYPIRHQYLE